MPTKRIDPQADKRPAVVARLAAMLNEPVMGFLALMALAVTLGPLVFDLNAAADQLLQRLEWILVGVFALNFVLELGAAESKAAWLTSPWRIIDIVAIGGPFVALAPGISSAAGSSLALRLLRVGRSVALATRAGRAAAGLRRGLGQTAVNTMPRVSRVSDGATFQVDESDWGTCLEWSRNPTSHWFHASEVSLAHIRVAARSAGLEPASLDEAFAPDAPARLRSDARSSLLFLWIPTVAETGFPAVTRVRITAIVPERGIMTATPEAFDLAGSISRLAARSPLPARSFPIRITLLLLALARERYHFTAQRFDEELRRFESIPISEGGRAFLEETFLLRREISAAALDLGHLASIVRSLADGRITLRGFNLGEDKFLDDLAAETGQLFDRVTTLKEDVQSLIELHINVKGFEMNNFLKLLAIVSFLGLIPTVVGGMLGMNVVGNPWPMTLGQVAFGVGMVAAVAMYVFAIKGWLR
ncbi:MAG: Mg2+ transporter protein CorA family [Planctomycetota bacterium]|nr:MAG: Mg2+ transporter protein CorA family [Planctomycetota bacterium]